MAASINDKFAKVISGTTRPVATTLASQKLSGATSASVVATTGWDTSTAVHGIMYRVDASNVKVPGSQIDWKGTISGTTINDFTVTAGSDDTYEVGTVVELSPTAAWGDDMATGLVVEHNQDGTHADITADSVTTDEITATTGTFTSLTINGAATEEGWSPLGDVPDTVTALGNRSYNLVFNGNDLTDTVSNGMRLKLTRTVTAPTQCADLEASSSQYFNDTSVSGMTFTDDFVVSAWIKLESYADMSIASRYNGTSGWRFFLTSAGRVYLQGTKAGSTNFRRVSSYQSIPLGKWVHVTAQLDMSTYTATTTTCYVMIDGVNVPAALETSGSNPTDLTQAGNLEIGAENGGTLPFDGKIAQVAIYSAKVTQATILASMNQTLTGSETSLVSAYTLSNSLLDLTANDNDLTANGGALATDTDSPFAGGNVSEYTDGTTEMGIIMKTAFSTNTTLTVQVPEGYALPTTGGISAVSYSTQKTPYGFPGQKGKWRLSCIIKSAPATTSNANYGTFNAGGLSLTIPVGSYKVGYQIGLIYSNTVTPVYFNLSNGTTLSGLSAGAGANVSPYGIRIQSPSAASTFTIPAYTDGHEELTVASTFSMYTLGATTSAGIDGSVAVAEIFAENGYL